MAKVRTARAGARGSTRVPPPVPQAEQVVAVEVWLPRDIYDLARWCYRHDHEDEDDRHDAFPFATFLALCIEGHVEDRVARWEAQHGARARVVAKRR